MSSVVKLHAWYFLFAKVDNWFYYVIDIGLLLFSTKKKITSRLSHLFTHIQFQIAVIFKKKTPNLVLISLRLLFLFVHAFLIIWDIPPPPFFLSPTPPYFQTDYMPLRKCTNFREASRKYIVQCDNHIVSYLTVP